jgi:cytochrome c biogenesis protein CcmG, thiol:disulfide interchange protein DsbE
VLHDTGRTIVVHVRPRLYWPITLAAAALIGLLAYGIASKGTDTSLDQSIAEGKPAAAPVSTLPRLGATGTGSLADYRGKPVLLNVWASWCPPCKQEIPLLEKAHQRMTARGGTVLGVDVQDDQADALAFLRSKRVTFPSLRDRDRSYVHELGVTGYPESFLIDRSGKVVAVSRGPVDQAWLNTELPKVLGA